ncbi:hypothetical protein [Psychromonas algicola]|uniref:hypothetical protein n=1 Tax=Psychromonas algicola TaxID=2555642 RepID=UPI001068ADD7|nr:hypothetical protein [Psychromonas sp. RZ5]TEW44075.1 hypothetical protein E2R67_15230 [Psychromonas sp. RZ5]
MLLFQKELIEIYENGDDEYKKINEKISSDVAYRKYSIGRVYDETPFFSEINEIPKGNLCDEMKGTEADLYIYGYSKENKLLSITQKTNLKNVFYKTFFISRSEFGELRTYNCSETEFELIKISFFFNGFSHPSKVESYTERALVLEEFKYRGNLIDEIHVEKKEHYTGTKSKDFFQLFYNQGEVDYIIKKNSEDDVLKKIKFENWDIAVDVDRIEKLLLENILYRLSSLPSEVKVHSVGLITDNALTSLSSPMLAIGTLDEYGNKILNVNSFKHYDAESVDIDSPELQLELKNIGTKEGKSLINDICHHVLEELSRIEFNHSGIETKKISFFLKDVSEL